MVLADLFRFKSLALQHVHEISIAAEVQLVRPIQSYSPIGKQSRQDTVRDRRPDLRLDVVADDGQATFLEPLLPVFFTGDEHWNTIDECTTGFQDLLDVPLGRHLAADRQVANHDVCLGILENLDDVCRGARGFGDDLGKILAQTVVRHPAVHGDAQLGYIGELVGIARRRVYCLAQVFADFVDVDVECGGEFNVANMIASETDVHEPGDKFIVLGIPVVMHALDERRRAIAHADNCDADFLTCLLCHDYFLPR